MYVVTQTHNDKHFSPLFSPSIFSILYMCVRVSNVIAR